MSLLSALVTSDLLVICLRVIVPGIIPRIIMIIVVIARPAGSLLITGIVIIVVTATMAVSTFISGFTSSISMDTRAS